MATNCAGKNLRFFLWNKKDVDKHQDGADCNGGVCHVEGGIAVGAEPDFEEIGDGAMHDAIGKITRGSTDEKSEAGEGKPSGGSRSDKEPSENSDEDERNGDESCFEIR